MFWFMENEGNERIRAETVKEEEGYLGDDVFEIWLQAGARNGIHRIAINTKGIVKYDQKRISREGGKIENFRNNQQGKQWQVVMEIPLTI